MQLKGAGPTPYSRTADGLAVLRSSLREFVCSEAMFHLGRADHAGVVARAHGRGSGARHPLRRPSGARARRRGVPHRTVVHGASATSRCWPARNNLQLLRHFLDFTISTDFPELAQEEDPQRRYLAWFAEVTKRTADMIAHWMRVGFVHGVMNTDNMSALGLTIDLRPVRLAGRLRPRLDAEHHRCGHAPLSLRPTTRRGAVEPAAARPGHPSLIGEAEPLNAILKDFATRLHAPIRNRQRRQARPAKLCGEQRPAAVR